MTARQSQLQRVRAANPVPVPVDPDWERVKEHVARGSRAEADNGRRDLSGDSQASGPRVAHGGSHRPRSRTVLGVLALATMLAAATLVAAAPWSSSPDFLAKAAAALTPQAGTILYERWEHTIYEPGNPAYGERTTVGPDQLWIQAGSPHRYRAVLEPDTTVPAGLGLAFAYGVNVGYAGRGPNLANGQNEVLNRLQRGVSGEPLELAGTLEAPTGNTRAGEVRRTLTFLPPDELLSARLRVTLGATLPGPHDQSIENGTDPVSALRAAIAEGRAHEAGPRELDGRSVQRIDLDVPRHPPNDAPPLPANAPVSHSEAYADVEPETFRPVEIVYGRDTYRFLSYEYLPATPANLALTDIQAQHPHATIINSDAATK